MKPVWDRIEVVEGDITKLEVDAIVNAANRTLLGGGGVDGAIHRAAGPGMLEQCRRRNGCAAGDAKVTDGFRLKAKWVIHTVGPVWKGGEGGEAEVLASCYRRCLEQAERIGATSVAFPGISTGAYGYPAEAAMVICVDVISEWLGGHAVPGRVVLCAFGGEALGVARAEVEARRG